MGQVIKMPKRRIYKPDINRKIKVAIENGQINSENLDFVLKICEILNRA